MSRKIIVYGQGNKTKNGFQNDEELIEYLGGNLFCYNAGRYRYTQMKSADIIVISRDGKAFGHLEVNSKEKPTKNDYREFPPVKQVYIIQKSVLYENTVRMLDVGISRYQFGKRVTENQFKKILKMAGNKKDVFQDIANK